MKFFLAVLLLPLLIIPAFAESQTASTDKGTLDVKLSHDEIEPNTLTKINIDFINPQTQKIQEHVDYTISVSKNGDTVFGPIPLTHTSPGSVKIPIEFNLGDGIYSMNFEVEGILFQPIPRETVSFDIVVGEAHAQPVTTPEEKEDQDVYGENGGCLIATATFGSEMAPQVQQLREIRDNTILKTGSGIAFMTTFNQFYYSFSPTIADLEREQPIVKEIMKMALTPMISSLSILNYVDINSEQEMIGYGTSIILLNLGMHIGIPIFGILKLYQTKRN
ncbi:CFI-box-CTERM domain-containing protein [Nitrosopumilus sp.]|uniref:CFI-box-CTERM domain-containing protein n=1 Tax=Nitrosopumilus sp. TaxID=2024843 RepID=UPI00292CCB11|nr:CFI-box-CTERM domain-containing protein [Nitrosopumilus sp.]